MNIPKELFAGDSASWDDNPTSDRLGVVIDSTWTLKYVISGASGLTLTATANGSGWSTSISKSQTSELGAGDYYWQAYAETGSRRETLGGGRIKIRSAAGSGVSGKSQARQDLDAVETAIRNYGTSNVAEYTIGGRSLRRIPMADLIVLRDKYKALVLQEEKAERIANGLGNPSNVFVRFRK